MVPPAFVNYVSQTEVNIVNVSQSRKIGKNIRVFHDEETWHISVRLMTEKQKVKVTQPNIECFPWPADLCNSQKEWLKNVGPLHLYDALRFEAPVLCKVEEQFYNGISLQEQIPFKLITQLNVRLGGGPDNTVHMNITSMRLHYLNVRLGGGPDNTIHIWIIPIQETPLSSMGLFTAWSLEMLFALFFEN